MKQNDPRIAAFELLTVAPDGRVTSFNRAAEKITQHLASSVVAAAKNLHGELLILHGMIDDNVHAQNCFQFVGALQKANKQNFQMMVYPGYRHGVGGRHIGRLRARFMKENL